MKTVLIVSCLVLLAAMQAPEVFAKETQEYLAEADQYYLEKNYKQAYKTYYKLAKRGDHYSQDRVSYMYVNGEGKSIDLTEAYAWSVLAAENGNEEFANNSDELLKRTDDQAKAQVRAKKLKKRYGKAAVLARAKKQAERESYKRSGSCTGSSLACSRG